MSKGNSDAGPSKGYQTRRLKAIADRWDAKASDWDRNLEDPSCHLNEDNAYGRFLHEARAVIHERRAFCRQQGLIDCGCATGLVLQQLVAGFAWGLGVDISPQMIRSAQAKQIPNSHFVRGDCFNLADYTQPAGAVVSRGVLLSHYGRTHARALLRSVRGALLAQGFLFCDFLNLASRERHQHLAADKTYFDSEEVLSLARAAGFGWTRIIGEPERRVLFLLAAQPAAGSGDSD
jgi:SAM-dependent methyltransferase